MPTLTAIALENFLEPAFGDSSPKNLRQLKQLPGEDKPPPARRPSHIFVSPALYTTPKSTPVPTSPVSVSPSPYVVVNRRRWGVREPENRLDGFQVRDGEAAQQNSGGREEEVPVSPAAEGVGDGGGVEEVGESLGKGLDEVCDGGEVVEGEEAERADDACLMEFDEPCDAASVISGCDADDGVCLQRGVRKHAAASSQNEFFDAPEGD